MSNETGKMISESIEVMKEVCDEWECNFLLSIRSHVQRKKQLSSKQVTKLTDIYKKVCSSDK